MSQNITFRLLDKYTLKLWNPKLLGDEPKSLYGEYFFNVIFSLHNQTTSENEKVSSYAVGILEKLLNDFEAFRCVLDAASQEADSLGESFPFECESNPAGDNQVELSGVGICPQNAAFLKLFVGFDDYISSLSKLKTIGAMDEKTYYRKRKDIQGSLFSILNRYNNIAKEFHKKRKSATVKIKAAAG